MTIFNYDLFKVSDNTGKWSDPGNFLKAQFVIFRCQKYVKKEYIEMTKKIYLETLKKCPGLLHFPLLRIQLFATGYDFSACRLRIIIKRRFFARCFFFFFFPFFSFFLELLQDLKKNEKNIFRGICFLRLFRFLENQNTS